MHSVLSKNKFSKDTDTTTSKNDSFFFRHYSLAKIYFKHNIYEIMLKYLRF